MRKTSVDHLMLLLIDFVSEAAKYEEQRNRVQSIPLYLTAADLLS